MDKLYWKSEGHKEDFKKVLSKMERDMTDRYYCSFAYLLSATGKVDNLLPFIDRTGVSSQEIIEAMQPYSRTEKSMILFALQLFNSGMSDIVLPEVIAGLDSYNYQCVMQSIFIRYGEPRYK